MNECKYYCIKKYMSPYLRVCARVCVCNVYVVYINIIRIAGQKYWMENNTQQR